MIACRAGLLLFCRLLLDTGTWQLMLGPAVSRALRPQFRDTDQVKSRAAEHEQPVHLRQSAQFHLFQGTNLLQPSERFLHQPAFA